MKNHIEINSIFKKYKIGGAVPDYYTIGDFFKISKKSSFDETHIWALRDVSFNVEVGTALGIIGKNGSGKSTLLKVISRITRPTQGNIKVNGSIASLLEVGTAFHGELTGKENIYLNGSILGMKKTDIKKRLDEIIDFSGIDKFINTPIKHYSSGMQLRLAFAVAAHLETDILILDEILAVGDAEFQKKSMRKVEKVANDGKTVLFVSHDMGLVSKICNKAIILDKGSLIAEGTTNEIVNMYSSYFFDNTESEYVASSDENNKKTFVLKAKTFNEKSNSFNIFYFDESIGLNVSVRINEMHGDLFLGVALFNSLKTRVFTTIKDLKNLNGNISMKFIFDKGIIAPGRYSFGIYLFRNHGPYIDVVEDILPIEIIDNREGDAFILKKDTGLIIMNPKCIIE